MTIYALTVEQYEKSLYGSDLVDGLNEQYILEENKETASTKFNVAKHQWEGFLEQSRFNFLARLENI